MKKIFKLNSDFLVRLKNFWFATQLLIVSASLPVMCVVQLLHGGNEETKQQQEQVIKNSAGQNQVIGLQNKSNTIKLS